MFPGKMMIPRAIFFSSRMLSNLAQVLSDMKWDGEDGDALPHVFDTDALLV